MRSVFLIGFMAAGKTTAGRLLAERMALPFVDLDDVIAERAGLPVPDIFEQRGEAEFRRLEGEALASLLNGAAVVATGGGTPCHGDALERMRASGLVIALAVPLDVALARAGTASERPLLARPADQIAALYHEREPMYRQAHAVIATDWRDPGEVADECAELISRAAVLDERLLPSSSIVSLGERSYPIAVARGGLGRLGGLARAALGPSCTRVALVADATVDGLYGAAAAETLTAAEFAVTRVPVPVGEPAKSIGAFAALCDELVRSGLDRSSAVVALGGGVVGDLAGFAAATLYRGVPLVQVPTTLVAMIDSAIGGKTGINLAAGKNLVGAFWQPRLVLADPDLLVSLPARERRAAFGELVKYALIDGEDLYAAAEALAPAIAEERWREPPPGLGPLIRRCTAIKSCDRQPRRARAERRARAAQPRPHRRPRHRGSGRLRRDAARRGGRAGAGGRLPGVDRPRAGPAGARAARGCHPGARWVVHRPGAVVAPGSARSHRRGQEADRVRHPLRCAIGSGPVQARQHRAGPLAGRVARIRAGLIPSPWGGDSCSESSESGCCGRPGPRS